jgi:hypothetical protein
VFRVSLLAVRFVQRARAVIPRECVGGMNAMRRSDSRVVVLWSEAAVAPSKGASYLRRVCRYEAETGLTRPWRGFARIQREDGVVGATGDGKIQNRGATCKPANLSLNLRAATRRGRDGGRAGGGIAGG